jgi:iron complex outermembrane receptor protein
MVCYRNSLNLSQMKSFLIALFLGFSIFANAQNKVVGTISDKQNKSISGVNISIPELHKETVSDENGKYLSLIHI